MDGGQRPEDGGLWTVEGGLWTGQWSVSVDGDHVDCGRWSVDWTVVCGQWTVDRYRLMLDGGGGRWLMNGVACVFVVY